MLALELPAYFHPNALQNRYSARSPMGLFELRVMPRDRDARMQGKQFWHYRRRDFDADVLDLVTIFMKLLLQFAHVAQSVCWGIALPRIKT
jgi:hypothetical protein